MAPHDPETSIYNLTGAIIFTAYVVSALFLTALIAYNLISSYRNLPSSYLSHKHGSSTISNHIRVYLTLTVLSFSVLSYHMLNFLIMSCISWARHWGIQLPLSVFGHKGLLGHETVQLHVWQWLTGSTLFLDFAQEICGTWPRYWWTSQALWATMGVSIFMGFHGHSRPIPHLWTYTALAQILPISYTLNLFHLALLLHPPTSSLPLHPPSSTSPTTPPQSSSSLYLTIYAALLLLPPFTLSTPVFIPLIFAIRLLLLVPVVRPQPLATPSIRYTQLFAGPPVVVWGGLGAVAVMRGWGLLGEVFGAVNEGAAVSALGWDYLLAAIGAGFWATRVGGAGGGEGKLD